MQLFQIIIHEIFYLQKRIIANRCQALCRCRLCMTYAMRFALCVMRVFENGQFFLMTLDVTTCLITQSLIDSTPKLPPNFFMDDTRDRYLKT